MIVGSVAQASNEVGNTISFSHTLGAGATYIIVGAACYGSHAGVEATATYNSVAMTRQVSIFTGPFFGGYSAIFTLFTGLPAPGTYTVAITFDPTAKNGNAGYCYALAGYQEKAPESTASTSSTSGATTSSLNITPRSCCSWVADCLQLSFGGGSVTAGPGQTQRALSNSAGNNITIYGSSEIGLSQNNAVTMSESGFSSSGYISHTAIALRPSSNPLIIGE
jgi:hypothetical protein